jgi:hypothetical protein
MLLEPATGDRFQGAGTMMSSAFASSNPAPSDSASAQAGSPALTATSPLSAAAPATAPITILRPSPEQISSTATAPSTPQSADRQEQSQQPSTLAHSPTVLPPTSATTGSEPTATPRPPTGIVQRVAEATTTVRVAQIEASINYPDGTDSTALVRFDLGDEQQAPRFQITSIYTGTAGTQTVERITIGERSWQRSLGHEWVSKPAQEGVWDQIWVFLPHTDSIMDPQFETNAGETVLKWYDRGREADVTLVVDPTTGIPHQMRQVTRSTGAVLTVRYSQWNLEVQIAPPTQT